MEQKPGYETVDAHEKNKRVWFSYCCGVCGGVVIAEAPMISHGTASITAVYPRSRSVDALIPERPRKRLLDAVNALHAPTASILSSGSAIDWMLKDKNYKEGSLFSRIEEAAADHLLTEGMKEWAHAVRLETNIERHADDDYNDPTIDDAERIIEFALALAEILYVLPERARQGRQAAHPDP